MKNTKFAIIFAALICRGFLSLLTAGQIFAAEPTLIQAGYGGIAGYQLPLWVNKEAGISRKYGIEIEPLLISGGSLNMQALLADDMESIEATYEFFSRRTESVPRPSLEGLNNNFAGNGRVAAKSGGFCRHEFAR